MYDDGLGSPPEPKRSGPVFRAGYEGRCAECGEPLHLGVLIQGRTDGRYVHHVCP